MQQLKLNISSKACPDIFKHKRPIWTKRMLNHNTTTTRSRLLLTTVHIQNVISFLFHLVFRVQSFEPASASDNEMQYMSGIPFKIKQCQSSYTIQILFSNNGQSILTPLIILSSVCKCSSILYISTQNRKFFSTWSASISPILSASLLGNT